MNEFPWDIKLEDTWFEYDYNKFNEVLSNYNTQRRKLEDMKYDATAPIPCRSWVRDYFFGNQPSYQAQMWKEIDEYIRENEQKEGWVFVDLHKEEVDVNSDPYDDYEKLTDMYTVYATVEKVEDFRQGEQYQTQFKIVEQLYNEVMKLKTGLDKKLKGEWNSEKQKQ